MTVVDSLKIALDTILVGALALPWMFMLVDLFCHAKEKLAEQVLPHLKNQTVAAVVGLLLFALAYLVGSSVVRISEDFFNDDDLSLRVTADQIRTDVYCQPSNAKPSDSRPGEANDWLIAVGVTPAAGVPAELVIPCPKDTAQIHTPETRNRVSQAFSVQESTLWLTAGENVDRLRDLHQQIVVLRGAAFDGFVVTLLCLFGACARLGLWGRISLLAVVFGLFAWVVDATADHLHDHLHNLAADPPLMEVVLAAIAVAGFFIAWKGVPQGRSYFCAFMFCALLTGIAFSGWWYTEIVYSKNVIQFYYSLSHTPPGVAVDSSNREGR